MKTKTGADCSYLDIDLTGRTWSVYEPSLKDITDYLGGKGLALKIYNDRLGERLDEINPLGKDNLLIFSMGPLLATGAPCSARFEILTKSPLTGLMSGSSCGGPFGEMCKTAGWDGAIIRGVSEYPVILRISSEGVDFEEAGELWGADTFDTHDRLGLTKNEGAAVIGPAGENLVSYASISSGNRFAGRGGSGAVMGSKRIKALVARGKEYARIPVDKKEFRGTSKKIRKYIERNAISEKYRKYGTNLYARPGIKNGYAPVRNFKNRYHPNLENLSGETMADKYSTTYSACRYCAILCGHKGTYPDGKTKQIPEYETTGMFGPNIENYDPDLIGEWNEKMNRLGMDTISAGGTIAWAMEAGEKGIRETELVFGKTGNIDKILTDIAFRRGEGDELACGTRVLAEKYGGSDFAIHVKGLECSAYDPRAAWGQGLSFAVYNKGGCHLGSYLVGMEILGDMIRPLTTRGKASWTVFFEDLYAAMNSLQICMFTTFGILQEAPVVRFTPGPVIKFAAEAVPPLAQALMNWNPLSKLFRSVTGIEMNKSGFLAAGERATKLERWMNCRMGVKPEEDTLPDRFTKEKETPFPGKNTVVPIEKMVKAYRKLRKYTPEGTPCRKDLEKLGIRRETCVDNQPAL